VIEWSAEIADRPGVTVLDRDADDAWVRARDGHAADRTDAAAVLADRVAGMTAHASGADDTVRVTVGSTGTITDLALDEAVRKLPAARLAQEILTVMRRAQARLSEQVATAVAETVGGDSATGRAVLDTFASRFRRQEPAQPVMPAPPFPRFPQRSSFPTRPDFPHQPTGELTR
jgi:hypothetical protein